MGILLTVGERLGRRDLSEDDAHEVGAFDLHQEGSATYVGRAKDNQFMYLYEIPMSKTDEMRYLEHSEGISASWIRFEFKIELKHNRTNPGDHLVIAWHPYSRGFVHYVPFKRGLKKTLDERQKRRDNPLNKPFKTSSELVQSIEDLSYDFWETGSFLTAGLSIPAPPFKAGIEKRSRHQRMGAVLVGGICNDFEACTDEISKSVEVKQLLIDTATNGIKFWYRRAKIWKHVELADSVIRESTGIMKLSIQQALAGPRKRIDYWIGKPVVEKVGHIYRGHLNALNRSVVGQSMPRRRRSNP